MKNDLESREDVELLVNHFYTSVQKDDLIGPIFNDIAKVDWNHHLPKMYDFFETILLGGRGFKGNPMEVHFSLNQKFPLLPEHFNRWQALFFQTIDTLFSGPLAEEAKQKASSIANLMQFKINQQGIDITLKQKPDESQPDSQI